MPLTSPASTGKPRFFFGWWIAAGALGVQVLLSGLFQNAFGTYATLWVEEFDWSKTTVALAFSLLRLETGLLGPVQGWLLQKFGVRPVMRVGLVLMAIGFLVLSRAQATWSFFAMFGLMAVGASLCGLLSIMTVLVNWFERRRATALAMMQAGISVGGLAVPIIAYALVTFGWRPTAAVSGVLFLIVGFPLVQIMHTRPEDVGLEPDGRSSTETEHVQSKLLPSVTARQALATRAFWLLSIGHACGVAIVSAVTAHLVLHLTTDRTLLLPQAAALFATMTAAMFVGQVIGGLLGDHLSKRILAAAAMFVHVLALVGLALIPTLVGVIVFAILQGTAWGVRGPLMGALRAEYFGRASFPMIMGISSLVVMLGATSGPVLAGVLADATGSYQLSFLMLALIGIAGAGMFALARPPIQAAKDHPHV